MGKIEQYQSYVLNILNDYAKTQPMNMHDVDNQVIKDEEGHHYVLIGTGWNQKLFSYSVIFHFDIKPDGKIWIMANNTDADVAEDLELQGVPKSDIVIGFQPKEYRQYTGYATA
ncbi:XisI protein [Fibrella sp. HMF5335]|uniref:XisI protein n=1 Tax=Fibrella rubiginis TaxID=2817060 RepID=A0A939K4D8_9BACT|nr:XisI protein [Fibrella rubiginis]MBO0936071.1 XisI protein [Fibrella rubiginis]